MQQWDAIHAILIYESLEIKEGIANESEAWSLTMPVKNLEMGFLLKVQNCSYPGLGLILLLTFGR